MASSWKPLASYPEGRVSSAASASPSNSAKRKAQSTAEPHSAPSPTTDPRPTKSLPTKSRQPESWTTVGETISPLRLGSAQRNNESLSNSRSLATNHSKASTAPAPTYARSHNAAVAAAAPTGQKEMEGYLESEMRGAIFCDMKFVDNFLSGDSDRLEAIVDRCECSPEFGKLPNKIQSERQLYEPVLAMLNTIKQAVDQEQGDSRCTNLFQNTSTTHIPSYELDTSSIKPDLVLFEDGPQHWEIVRMPIEVKKLTTYLKVGMKQLARYARAVFAHQIHRRHLYGMVICGVEATFVRFDRAGILYSPPIDMRKQREQFTRAFGSLMLMDEETFGYDTAFSTKRNQEGQLEYYVDLPEAAFDRVPSSATSATTPATSVPGPSNRPGGKRRFTTRRLKVMERLCHRKSIRGRATIVLRLREVLTSGTPPAQAYTGAATRSRTTKKKQQEETEEVLGTQDFVLKLIWRDPKRESEGEMMKELVGIFGLAQYLWHSDVYKACQCEGAAGGHCEDKTPSRDDVWANKNLRDIDIEVAEADDQTDEYQDVDTNECIPIQSRRTGRTYSRILMSSIGEPLWAADSPRRFLAAVLDAILGYWRLVNMGYLHRDISDGNVLMLSQNQQFSEREWKGERAKIAEGQSEMLAKSEKLLQETLDKLDRDPTGILADYDLHTTHTGMDQPSTKQSEANTGLKPSSSETPQDPDVAPSSKRRKTNSSTPIAVSGGKPGKGKGKQRETSRLTAQGSIPISQIGEGQRRDIDFRTGTPTFMSVRVLEVPIGQEYQHSFLDDIQSFFWLILWVVAAHLDPGKDRPTTGAFKFLNGLTQTDLDQMASYKFTILAQCQVAEEDEDTRLQSRLHSFENSWASDSSIHSVIFRLGYILARANAYPKKVGSKMTPISLFPQIVEIFLEALT